MRIVYLNPCGQLGGAEWSLLNLIGGVRASGRAFEPVVVTTEDGPLVAQCTRLSIRTRILPLPARLEEMGDAGLGGEFRSLAGRGFRLAGCAKDVAQYAWALRRLVSAEHPSLVHTNGFKMHLLGAWSGYGVRAARSPALVGHIHDYVSSRPLAGKLLRSVAQRFRCFIANSSDVADDVRRSLRIENVHAVHNAVDLTRFTPEGPRLDLDAVCGLEPAAPGTIRVGLVATFARWKGHLSFLRALAEASRQTPLRGYIIGGPIYRTAGSQFSLEELAAEAERLGLGGHVGFTGFVEDTAQAIRGLDFTVHASTAAEPFGMAIVEAMACGKAVLVSELGGARELFEEGVTALGCKAGDAADLAKKMVRAARDQALREELGRVARRSVCARFEPRAIAALIWQAYEQAVSPAGLMVPVAG